MVGDDDPELIIYPEIGRQVHPPTHPPTIHSFNVDNQMGGWMDFYAYLVWTELWRSDREELALGLRAQLILQHCTSGPETGSYREISINNNQLT